MFFKANDKKKFVICKYTLKTSEIIITDTILNNNIKPVINKNTQYQPNNKNNPKIFIYTLEFNIIIKQKNDNKYRSSDQMLFIGVVTILP